jgi:hypothetical protein
MWALVIMLLAAAFGWSVVRLLPFRWFYLEAAAASVAVGWCLLPWLYFLTVWALGWQAGFALATGLAVLGVAAGWKWICQRLEFEKAPKLTPRRLLVWLPALVLAAWLAWLVAVSYYFPGTGDWLSNGNVWGDSPLHVSLTTQFAHGDKLDLVAPYYGREALTYPFISDFWSGVLLRASGSWILSLTAPSVVMMLALLILVYFASRRLLESALGGWLAWYMLVLSGPAVGGVKVLEQLAQPGTSAQTVLTSLGNASNYSYVNLLYSHSLPQRSYLFGMALLIVAALIALELARRREATNRPELRLAGIIGGVLVGLMPLVHTHSFLVMGVLLGLATVLLWWRERRLPQGWIWMCFVGVALAIPQVAWQFAHSYKGFSHPALAWTGAVAGVPAASWAGFWAVSFGWLWVMILGGWYLLWRGRVKAEVWLVYVAGLIIFIACNVYVFQPSTWDNMKLLEYSAWFLMLSSAAVLVGWRHRLLGRVAVGAVMVSLCVAGFITLVPGARLETYTLVTAAEVRFGEKMRTDLPNEAYLLVGDRHNSAITMFSDRKVLMTYGGWFNLYGKDWAKTMADRTRMLQGGEQAAPLMKQYGVNFAAFSDSEVYSEGVNLKYFQDNYKVFDHEAGWWVFDLRHPA